MALAVSSFAEKELNVQRRSGGDIKITDCATTQPDTTSLHQLQKKNCQFDGDLLFGGEVSQMVSTDGS